MGALLYAGIKNAFALVGELNNGNAEMAFSRTNKVLTSQASEQWCLRFENAINIPDCSHVGHPSRVDSSHHKTTVHLLTLSL